MKRATRAFINAILDPQLHAILFLVAYAVAFAAAWAGFDEHGN